MTAAVPQFFAGDDGEEAAGSDKKDAGADTATTDSEPLAFPKKAFAHLERLGPWVPSDDSVVRAHRWLGRFVDEYTLNFELKRLRYDQAAHRRSYAFGGTVNSQDFAYACADFKLYNGYTTGDLRPACRNKGCEVVTTELKEDLARVARNAREERSWSAGWLCNFTFDDVDRPQALWWEVVHVSTKKVAMSVHLKSSHADVAPRLATLQSATEISRRCARLDSFGAWQMTAPGDADDHPWLQSFLEYQPRFTVKRLRFVDGGKQVHTRRVCAFGGQRTKRNYAYMCTYIEVRAASAVSALESACQLQGCADVVDDMWNDIFIRAGHARANPPPLECRFTFDNDRNPRAMTWEIGEVAAHSSAAPPKPVFSFKLRRSDRGGRVSQRQSDGSGVADGADSDSSIEDAKLMPPSPISPFRTIRIPRRRLEGSPPPLDDNLDSGASSPFRIDEGYETDANEEVDDVGADEESEEEEEASEASYETDGSKAHETEMPLEHNLRAWASGASSQAHEGQLLNLASGLLGDDDEDYFSPGF